MAVRSDRIFDRTDPAAGGELLATVPEGRTYLLKTLTAYNGADAQVQVFFYLGGESSTVVFWAPVLAQLEAKTWPGGTVVMFPGVTVSCAFVGGAGNVHVGGWGAKLLGIPT